MPNVLSLHLILVWFARVQIKARTVDAPSELDTLFQCVQYRSSERSEKETWHLSFGIMWASDYVERYILFILESYILFNKGAKRTKCEQKIFKKTAFCLCFETQSAVTIMNEHLSTWQTSTIKTIGYDFSAFNWNLNF